MKKIVQDKNFDLYTHMKINIKCSSPFCEIHDSAFTDYCLGCKRPVCEICRASFHSTHILQEMNAINFDNTELIDSFQKLEKNLKSYAFFQDPDSFKNTIKQKITDEFAEIENMLYDIKEGKLDEIDMIFSSFDPKSITETVSVTGKMLRDYVNKNKSYYYDSEVKDEDNVIFLQTYDLFNGISSSLNEYQTIIDEITSFFNSFENSDKNNYSKIKNLLSQVFEEDKKNSLRSNKCIMMSKEELNFNTLTSKSNKKDDKGEEENVGIKLLNYFDKLREDFFKETKEKLKKTGDFIENFKKATFESFKKHGSFIDIEKTVKIFDEKTNKRTNFIKGKANLKFSPSQAKAYSLNGVLPPSSVLPSPEDSPNSNILGSSNVNEAVKRDSMGLKPIGGNKKQQKITPAKPKGKELAALEEGDEDLDSDCYDEKHQKHKSDDLEEEKNKSDSDSEENLLFENEDEIVLENGYGKLGDMKLDKDKQKLKKMFMPLKKEKKPLKTKPDIRILNTNEEKDKFKVNGKLQEIIKENQRLTNLIKKSDDINLVITVLRRYYSYVALEFVRKNFFKLNNKSMMSSNMLLEKKPRDEDLKDNVRLMEGTNEIQIFCREKRKLMKKVIPLNKQTHGTTVFPIGCRSYISRDRLYITGGKDPKSNNDTKLFLVYSFKDNKIIKLPDMKKARSYHTIVFHENLKSLLVFGGENNKSCEIYDFFVNAWNEIPELNIGRANINIYIDKIGTFAYAFCGCTGSITQSGHSDVIELLDLVDMNQGWAKVDYNNKALVDLRFSHNGIYPLTEDKLLIYGAKESRKVHKVFVIFDLRTFDLVNVDNFYLDDLRKQAVKNPELSKILM